MDNVTVDNVFGILAIAAGVFNARGIWIPRFRPQWKGTRMISGPVTCAGFSVLFISFGAMWLCIDRVAERYRVWFALPIGLGCLLMTVGYVLDWRAYARTDPTALPQEHLVAKDRRWLLIVFWVVVSIALLSIIFSHL